MTEHAIVVVSEAHAAPHMPAIPDVGAWSASAADVVDAVVGIELMAAAVVAEALETTWLAHIRLSPSATAPSNPYRHHCAGVGRGGARTLRG